MFLRRNPKPAKYVTTHISSFVNREENIWSPGDFDSAFLFVVSFISPKAEFEKYFFYVIHFTPFS